MAQMSSAVCRGILIEYDTKDDEQKKFLTFVFTTLRLIKGLSNEALGPLGEDFLKEFSNDQLNLKSYHEVEGVKYTLLIRPPMVKNITGGTTTVIDVMQAKNLAALPGPSSLLIPTSSSTKGLAQIIECWWPESQNSTLRKGINVLPPMQKEKKVQLEGEIETKALETDYKPPSKKTTGGKYTLENDEFFYYGQRHTYQIALIHEMIHAWHGISGTSLAGPEGGTKAEEKMVVGIYGNENVKYTENKFRALLNMPPRTDYKSQSIPKYEGNQAVSFMKAFQTWCGKQ
jgi:hypothetical protein